MLAAAPLRGRIGWTALLTVLVAVSGVAPTTSSRAQEGTFSLVGVHPEAAAYPAVGNSLVSLTPWKGRLYAGYGHWLEFYGIRDFAVRAYDPAANELVSHRITRAEAIWNFRPIGEKLYAPLTDPFSEIDYVVGEPWEDRDAVVGATRVFDMASSDGSDLFMVGSTGADAVAWRSTDGGQAWQESLRVSKQDPNDLETHFGFALAAGGKLYVQAYGVGRSGAHPASKVFGGGGWSDGPNLLPDPGYKGWKPTAFAGSTLYLSGEPGNPALALLRFDGERAVEVPAPFRIWDFFVAGEYVYALVVDESAPLWAPVIRRTRDLITWTDVGVPPTNSRSIGILGDSLYVGATGGRLFKYSEPLGQPPSRRPSSLRFPSGSDVMS
jgi:hypothetical protein